MSNQLMDTLENKVFTAVDTIETLRLEINELREERRILEDKLRDLIGKMEGLDNSGTAARTEDDSDNSGPTTPGPSFGPTY
jgi:FtsZ-binding cell division protein ZapB